MRITAHAAVVLAGLAVASLARGSEVPGPPPPAPFDHPTADGNGAALPLTTSLTSEALSAVPEPGPHVPHWPLATHGPEPAAANPLLGIEPTGPRRTVPSPIVGGRVIPAHQEPPATPPVPTFHIPEPSSIILVVTGMIGLVARRHLRRQIMAAD